jgi:hypothetical protein
MALKNSRTGSLPVSEIYGFMKEHFPYFKVRSREMPLYTHEIIWAHGSLGTSATMFLSVCV